MKDSRLRRSADTVRTIVWVALDRQITFMAGSIAYSVFMSLVPLLLLLFVVGSALGGPELADHVVGMVGGYLAPSGEQVIHDALGGEQGRGSASFIGLAVLLWSTLKIFRGLDTAFAVIYDTPDKKSFLEQLRDGTITFVTVGAAVLVTVVAGSVFVLFSGLPHVGLLNPVLLLIALTVAFFPLYYILPDTDVPLDEAAPGAVVAALGWVLLEIVFQFYAASTTGATYDVIGGVVLLLAWLYFSGLIVMLGAVVNVVLSGRVDESGDLLPEPVKHGPRDLILDEPEDSPPPDDDGNGGGDGTPITPTDVGVRSGPGRAATTSTDPVPGVRPAAAGSGGEVDALRRIRGRAVETPRRSRAGRSRRSVVVTAGMLATAVSLHRSGRAGALVTVPLIWLLVGVCYLAWPVVPTEAVERRADRLRELSA